MNNNERKTQVKILEEARDFFETELQYDPRCPYFDADEFVGKVKEVLCAGYNYDTEGYLLEQIPFCDSISKIISVLNVNASCGGISFITQEAGRRTHGFWSRHEDGFPILVQLGYSKWQNIGKQAQAACGKRYVGNKTEAQRQKSFAQKLRRAVKYLHAKNYLPNSILDLTMRTDALFYNATSHFSGLLYAILDYGFPRLISEQEIDDKCWMEAIELTLCRHSDCKALDFIHMTEASIEEVMDHIWFQVVVYGCLIYTIRTLGNEMTYPVISDAYQGIDPAEQRIKYLQQQAEMDRQAIEEGQKIIDMLESKVKDLQHKLDQTPDYSRQISALNHEHKLALKEKDQKILSLLNRIERMEEERMEMGQQMFRQDEETITDKPWLNITLPRDNIVFLGGHPNMVKKLREAYPEWIYIGTEKEALHNLPKFCDFIFIWSGHISHGTWYHIDKSFEGREKFLFVQATNIQRLEEEMKYELWKRQQSGKDGGCHDA